MGYIKWSWGVLLQCCLCGLVEDISLSYNYILMRTALFHLLVALNSLSASHDN